MPHPHCVLCFCSCVPEFCGSGLNRRCLGVIIYIYALVGVKENSNSGGVLSVVPSISYFVTRSSWSECTVCISFVVHHFVPWFALWYGMVVRRHEGSQNART